MAGAALAEPERYYRPQARSARLDRPHVASRCPPASPRGWAPPAAFARVAFLRTALQTGPRLARIILLVTTSSWCPFAACGGLLIVIISWSGLGQVQKAALKMRARLALWLLVVAVHRWQGCLAEAASAINWTAHLSSGEQTRLLKAVCGASSSPATIQASSAGSNSTMTSREPWRAVVSRACA